MASWYKQYSLICVTFLFYLNFSKQMHFIKTEINMFNGYGSMGIKYLAYIQLSRILKLFISCIPCTSICHIASELRSKKKNETQTI